MVHTDYNVFLIIKKDKTYLCPAFNAPRLLADTPPHQGPRSEPKYMPHAQVHVASRRPQMGL